VPENQALWQGLPLTPGDIYRKVLLYSATNLAQIAESQAWIELSFLKEALHVRRKKTVYAGPF
jgi:hypothetical protein